MEMKNKKEEKTCKIEQMSWREIITKYGIQLDGENAHWICLEHPGEDALKEANRLFGEKDIEGIIDFLEKNKKSFDKVKYIMIALLNLSKDGNVLKHKNILYGNSFNNFKSRYRELESLLQDADSNGIYRVVSDMDKFENSTEFGVQICDIKRVLNSNNIRVDKNKQKQIRLLEKRKNLNARDIISRSTKNYIWYGNRRYAYKKFK